MRSILRIKRSIFHYIESPSPKDACLVPCFVEIGPVVLGKITKFRQWNFSISLLSPLGKGAWPFIWTNINPLPSKILFENYLFIFNISQISPLRNESGPSFEQILISFIQECIVPSSVETGSVVLERILKFYYFQIIPFRKSGVLPLNKLDFSLPKDSLCQVWLERALLF